MSCPKCSSENITSSGFYITKLYKKRDRFKCKDCKRTFIVGKHLDKITLKQEKEIIRLSKRTNPYASKYDGRKKKTYSIREIEKIMNISHSMIEKVLNLTKK